MSRMPLLFVPLLAAAMPSSAEPVSAGAALSHYEALTAGNPKCRLGVQRADEIVVCARRDADRYRVPLVVADAGDPAIQDVPTERERLQYKRTPCQNYDLFLVGCGMAGVSVSTRFNGSGIEYRKLAD